MPGFIECRAKACVHLESVEPEPPDSASLLVAPGFPTNGRFVSDEGSRRGDVLQDAGDESGVLFVEVGRVALAGEDALDRGGDAPVTLFELGQGLFDLGASLRAVLVGTVAPGDGGDVTQERVEVSQDLDPVWAGADEAGFAELFERGFPLVWREGVEGSIKGAFGFLGIIQFKGLANGRGELGEDAP